MARAGSSTRRKRPASDEAESNGSGDVRVTGLHSAHAEWLEAEYGAEVNATDIAWVYKTRNQFRKSDAYADYLDEKDAEREAAEEAKASEPKRKRGRPARKASAEADDEPDEDSDDDAEETPAAATPVRRGRRAATQKAPAASRSRARKPAAAAEDEEESAPAATPSRRGRGRAAKKDAADAPF